MDENTFLCIILIVSLLVAISIKIYGLEKLFNSLQAHCLHHDKLFNDIDIRREGDLLELDRAVERIQALEEKIKALEDTVEYLEGQL